MPPAIRYPIAAVARLTGLGLDTIRAWERRYGAVVPERGPRGRLYTQAQVRRLRLLSTLVGAGHPIGQVASLPDRTLEELLRRAGEVRGEAPAAPEAPAGPFAVVLDAIERFDQAAADRELGRLAALHSPRDLVFEVALPLMRTVGERWHAGALTVAQEHMASSVLHSVLGTLLRVHGGGAEPQLLFATLEGELHEFGILAAAMLAASLGLGAVYLGPNLPAPEIALAARKTGVAIVVVGVTRGSDVAAALLRDLREALPRDVELWVGGRLAPSAAAAGRRTGAVSPLESFEDYEEALRRLRPGHARAPRG